MKNLNRYQIFFAAFALFIVSQASAQTVWDGTADTDWYDAGRTNFTITQAEEFAGLAELVIDGNDMTGKTFTLGADIILNDTTDWRNWFTNPPANLWTSIGCRFDSENIKPFGGVFDGGGYAVSGVYINSSSDYQGLFGVVSNAEIKNISVLASYVKGGSYTGGLAGRISGGIANCGFRGNVDGGSSYVGGLTGYNLSGVITDSYAAGNVTGTNYVGGLTGYNLSGITNCYAAGAVKGNNSVGGFAGNNGLSGSITNCYAAGSVTGNVAGGFCGANTGGITNCYYGKETSGKNDTGKGVGLTTNEMAGYALIDKLNFYALANNLNAWIYRVGLYPGLSGAHVYDSDFLRNGDGTQNSPFIMQTPEQLKYFSIVVNAGRTFEGEYIKLAADIMLNDTTDWKNWANNPSANSWTPVGTSSSRFRGTFDGDDYVIGGIYVNSLSDYQGLFGAIGGAVIKNLGVVASYVKGKNYVGGLTGHSNSGSMITNCYAVLNVEGTGTGSVGGLAGCNLNGTITDCYAAGAVTGITGVGGLLGENYNGGMITNCYAASNVAGSVGASSVGGLVGLLAQGEITNSYYDKETSGQSGDEKGAGMTTAQMTQQTTYADWDFTGIWAISPTKNNGYPFLRVSVKNILGVITSGVYNETKLLGGTVVPAGATNGAIVYSVISGGAAINGNSITFNAVGEVAIRATIVNATQSGDYTKDFVITAAKANPTRTAPTGLTATVGQTLEDIALPQYWSWMAPSSSVGTEGYQVHKAKFTPSDTLNYNIISDINILITVSAAQSPISGAKKSDARCGIRFLNSIVSDKLEIEDVIIPIFNSDKTESAKEITVVIYDNTGNVVYSVTKKGRAAQWNLTNQFGRNVADGGYLVIVEAKDKNGKVYRYFSKVGVNR